MNTYFIILSSKNLSSINFSILFFKKLLINNILKNKFTFQKIKKLTLLKSPHIYKRAQEHLGSKFYMKKISIFTHNFSKLLIIIKKVLNFAFYDLNIKIKHFLTFKIKFCLISFKSVYFKLNCFFYKKRVKTYYFLNSLNYQASLFKT